MPIAPDKKRTGIVLPEILINQLQAIAKEQKRSFNNLVTIILEDYVEQHYCKDSESTEIPRLEELLT